MSLSFSSRKCIVCGTISDMAIRNPECGFCKELSLKQQEEVI